MDLSAAFDLIRPGIFAKKAENVIEDRGLVWLIHQFLINRKAYVEVNSTTSPTVCFSAGCPQGSTLGPKVFNVYCNDLYNSMKNHGFLVSFADDSYVVIDGDDREQLLEKTKQAMCVHLEWLKRNGMVCNVTKTEVMIMNEQTPVTIEIDGNSIKTKTSMRVLGILFDEKLSWSSQVSATVSKTNRLMFGLKSI